MVCSITHWLRSDQKKLVGMAGAICVLAWIVAAIKPLDRETWLLENILVIAFAAVLLLVRQRIQLSSAAYLCLCAFLLLHIIGAHYTYAKMPLGFWAQEHFGFRRNHFDRVTHFAFGFFLSFPLCELLLRFSGAGRGWAYSLAVAIILAVSGFFELIEAVVAERVAPGEGVNWLGGQGDEWDAQNDMLAALMGAVAMITLLALVRRLRRRAR